MRKRTDRRRDPMTETERKLRLTRHIREENAMNRVKMKSRGKSFTETESP